MTPNIGRMKAQSIELVQRGSRPSLSYTMGMQSSKIENIFRRTK
jgi:hypothetical protein